MARHVRGPALPVYAMEPLPVVSPMYVRGPAEPVYFVPGPDGSYIPCAMIDPACIVSIADPIYVRKDETNLLTGTVRTSACLATYVDIKARNQEQRVHGNFYALSSADALNSGSPINATNGIGKVIIAVLAGTDLAGTITVTGTRIDRNTGVETPGFSEDIVIDALTTDASALDSNGNLVHSFTGAYITSSWYFGAVVISTADVTLTDVDTYGIAFEQLNDDPTVQLETIDVTIECNNTLGWAHVHFYTIEVTAPKCNIGAIVDMHISVAESEADRDYRLRRDLGNAPMDGTTNGMWVELGLGPLNQNYWENINVKIWFSTESAISMD